MTLSSCTDKKLENERSILNDLRGLESNPNTNLTLGTNALDGHSY